MCLLLSGYEALGLRQHLPAQVAVYNYQKLQLIRAKAKQSAGKDVEKSGRAGDVAVEPEKQVGPARCARMPRARA